MVAIEILLEEIQIKQIDLTLILKFIQFISKFLGLVRPARG